MVLQLGYFGGGQGGFPVFPLVKSIPSEVLSGLPDACGGGLYPAYPMSVVRMVVDGLPDACGGGLYPL